MMSQHDRGTKKENGFIPVFVKLQHQAGASLPFKPVIKAIYTWHIQINALFITDQTQINMLP